MLKTNHTLHKPMTHATLRLGLCSLLSNSSYHNNYYNAATICSHFLSGYMIISLAFLVNVVGREQSYGHIHIYIPHEWSFIFYGKHASC